MKILHINIVNSESYTTNENFLYVEYQPKFYFSDWYMLSQLSL